MEIEAETKSKVVIKTRIDEMNRLRIIGCVPVHLCICVVYSIYLTILSKQYLYVI